MQKMSRNERKRGVQSIELEHQQDFKIWRFANGNPKRKGLSTVLQYHIDYLSQHTDGKKRKIGRAHV